MSGNANTNAVRGMVKVELNWDQRDLAPDQPARTRRLWFPLGTMMRLKKEHGIRLNSIEKAVLDGEGDLQYENIAILIAAGLSHEDDQITPEWVLAHVDMPEFPTLLQKVMEAIGEANGGNASGAPVPPAAASRKK